MIGSFDFTGTGREINASGAVFRYERGNSQGASTGLRVRADGQDLGTFEPGDSVRLPAPAVRWELIPVSAALAGFVRIGPASFETSRVSGEVAIAPSTYSLAMKNRAFVRNFSAGTIAGQQLEFQLWMPATAARALVITQLANIGSSPSNAISGYIDQTAATNPFGWAWCKRNGVRHDLVGALFETRGYTTPRAPYSVPSTGLVYLERGNPNVAFGKNYNEPVVVMPGSGITFSCHSGGVAGQEWLCQAEFLEVPLSEL